MGKRNKSRKEDSTTECKVADSNIEEETINDDGKINKRSKKKNKRKIVQEDNKIVMDNPKESKVRDESEHDETSNSSKNNILIKKKKLVKNIQNHETEKQKKIKFGENGEPQVVSPENLSSDSKVKRDEKSYLNAEEKDIKDEDIDRFCADIDEEDNEQYQSWITLLEQKLGNNESTVNNKSKNKNKNIVQ